MAPATPLKRLWSRSDGMRWRGVRGIPRHRSSPPYAARRGVRPRDYRTSAVSRTESADYPSLTVNVVRRLSAVPLMLLLGACSGMPIGEGGPATWAHDPAAEISPDTTAFTAWVTERSCASGQSSAARIIGPDVQVSTEAIEVTFRVRRLTGSQACPGNPPTPVTVTLPEPLGDRMLLDGGREPPQEPPTCANPESCE